MHNGGGDVFLAKLDAAGEHVWSKRFGEGLFEGAFGVTLDPSGDVVVVGQFEGAVDFGAGVLTATNGYDMFVAKYAP